MSWKKIITASSSQSPPQLTAKDLLASEGFTTNEILKIIHDNGPKLEWHRDQTFTDSGYSNEADSQFPTNVTGSVADGVGMDIHTLYDSSDISLSFGPYSSVTVNTDYINNATGVCSQGTINNEADCLEGDAANNYTHNDYTWTYGFNPAVAVPVGSATYASTISTLRWEYETHTNGIVSSHNGEEAVGTLTERILYMDSTADASNALTMGAAGTDGDHTWEATDHFTGDMDAQKYVHTVSHPARTDADSTVGGGPETVNRIRMSETVNAFGHLRDIGNAIEVDKDAKALTDIKTITAGHESLGDFHFGQTIALSPHDPEGTGVNWNGSTNSGTVEDPNAGNYGTGGGATDRMYADKYLNWNMQTSNATLGQPSDTNHPTFGFYNLNVVAFNEDPAGNAGLGSYTNKNVFVETAVTADLGNSFVGQMNNGSLTVTGDTTNGTDVMEMTFAAPGGGSVSNSDFPYNGPDAGGSASGGANASHIDAAGQYAERDGFAAGVMRLMYVGDGMKASPAGGGGRHYSTLEAAISDGSNYEGPTGLSTMGADPTFRMADPATLHMNTTNDFITQGLINDEDEDGPNNDTTNRHTHNITAYSTQQSNQNPNNLLITDNTGSMSVEDMYVDFSLIAPGDAIGIDLAGEFRVQDEALQINVNVANDGSVTGYPTSGVVPLTSVILGYGGVTSSQGLKIVNSGIIDKMAFQGTDNAYKAIGGCDNNEASDVDNCTGNFIYGANHMLVHGYNQPIDSTAGFNTNMALDDTFIPATGTTSGSNVTLSNVTTPSLAHEFGALHVDTWMTTDYMDVGTTVTPPEVDSSQVPNASDGYIGWDDVGGTKYLFVQAAANMYDDVIEN